MVVLAIIMGFIAVGTLLLWYVPALMGYGSSFDGLFFAAWLALVALLLVLWFFRRNSLDRLQRTMYLDFAGKTGYSQISGAFSFVGCDDLMDSLVERFSRKHSAIATKEAPSEDFNPTAVVNTHRFVCSRGPDAPTPLVEEWQGIVELIRRDGEREPHPFSSEMQLEGMLQNLCNGLRVDL